MLFKFCIISSIELYLVLWLLYDIGQLLYTIYRAMLWSMEGGTPMDTKAVGQRIKAAREKRGLTQEELAALVKPDSRQCDRTGR